VRASKATVAPPTETTVRALDALPVGGAVLDIGCGGGATSLPLAERAGTVTGVDQQPDMLEAFRGAAAAAGLDAAVIEGSWPAAASAAPLADVVVCGHVLYNVADLPPFIEALTARARARVVVEITARHPLVWLNDLWRRFHDVRFPEGPTADEALEVVRSMGIAVAHQERPASDAHRGGFERREDAVALIRRRLCLTPDRDDELAEALGPRLRQEGTLWAAGPPEGSPVVTAWWDGAASAQHPPVQRMSASESET
jgi:SAM-dependent methyltransferase